MHAGCVYVAGIRPSRTCVHRLDLGLYSHPKVVMAVESETMLTQRGEIPSTDRLVGLVVRRPPSRAEGPRFESRLRWDFFGVESYQ